MSAFPSWLPFALLPVVMPVMWVLVGLALSVASGWRRLTPQWVLRDVDDILPTRLTSGRVGLVGYRNCIWIGSDENSLVIGVMLPFRLGHPWLRLPWSAVAVEPPRGLLLKTQVLRLDPAGADVRVRLPKDAADEVLAPRPLDG